jgi:hypothetical protein
MGEWHLLVGCLMLNRTERRQAKRALIAIFSMAPRPEDLAEVEDSDLMEALRPCGFGNRRLKAIRALTEDWLAGLPVEEIRYCGRYASDSHDIFVRGRDVERHVGIDAELARYLDARETSP